MKQSVREKYEDLTRELKSLEVKGDEIATTVSEISEERSKLIDALILEDRLLEGSVWELDPSGYVYFKGDKDGNKRIKKLDDLIRTDWHFSREMCEGISFNFSDNSIYLSVDDFSKLESFVKLQGIVLDISSVEERVKEMKADLESLLDLIKKYKIE